MSKSKVIPGQAQPLGTNLSVALAVARQRLGDAHFEFALEMIRRGRGEVAAPQALTIYARLHTLTELDMQSLRNRVLVYLGQIANTEVTHLPNTFVAIDGDVEWDVTASMVERIRRRLNGRNNYAFRDWVELHTGHAHSKLARMHIENLVSVHEAAGGMKAAETVRLYIRELALRDGLFEPLYNGLLERLYEASGADLDAFEDDDVSEAVGEESSASAGAEGAGGYGMRKKA